MIKMEFNMAFRHILLNVGLILILIIILSTAKFNETAKNETELHELNYNVSNGTHLKPLHYDVKIKFDVYENVFFGKCNIIIQINRSTENITMMYSKIFNIVEIDLIDNNNNKTINIQKFSLINKSFNKMYIHFNFTQSSIDHLSPGTYILQIIYVRIMYDEDFFESFHTGEEKETLFKIIRAEELFPCWDEPEFISTFNISIWHHKNHKYFSANMPIREQVEDIDDMLWTHFDTSPSMSAEHLTILMMATLKYNLTYLTLINAKFWCRKEITEHQVQFAKTIIIGTEHYLAHKNARNISKIDYFVVKDFQHSNAKTIIRGIILLREEDIIYNSTLHPARKIKIANLIAREIISQWYYDVFLLSKEGFIMFLATHILHKNWLYHRIMDLFVVQTLQESLRFDTFSVDSHPLNSTNMSTVYSSFRYIKASITWRMLYHMLSDDTFWTIINTYNNIQYNQTNAIDNLSTTATFWSIVKNVTNNKFRNIENIFYMWLIIGYHPLLRVTREMTKFQNSKMDSLLISYIDSQYTLFAYNMKQYNIYLTYTTTSDMNFELLLDTEYEFLSSLVPDFKSKIVNNDWIILNLQQTGYYRVYYDVYNWQKLADYLYFVNYTNIHVLNRAQIIDDAFNFLKQGQLSLNLFWNITRFLLNDTDYIAWYPMIKAIEYMTCVWSVPDILTIKNKIKEMFDRLLLNIGYDDEFESDFTQYLREEAVKWACVLGVYKCRQTAFFQLEKQLENPVEDKYFKRREWIYCKGLMIANYTTWSKVLWHKWNTMYKQSNIYSEYLTCSTDPYHIQVYLDVIINGFYSNMTNNPTIAKIVLLTFAKHANNNIILNFILFKFEFFKFSLKKQVDQVAMLIVIITHEHNVEHFDKISKFVFQNTTTGTRRIDNAVKLKIKKRKQEYVRHIMPRFLGRYLKYNTA